MEWEQSASIMSMISQHTSMLAASRGVKLKAANVVDLMPQDSVPWLKRGKHKAGSVTSGRVQAVVLKNAFGFR